MPTCTIARPGRRFGSRRRERRALFSLYFESALSITERKSMPNVYVRIIAVIFPGGHSVSGSGLGWHRHRRRKVSQEAETGGAMKQREAWINLFLRWKSMRWSRSRAPMKIFFGRRSLVGSRPRHVDIDFWTLFRLLINLNLRECGSRIRI